MRQKRLHLLINKGLLNILPGVYLKLKSHQNGLGGETAAIKQFSEQDASCVC
jgi:hypothetical protein